MTRPIITAPRLDLISMDRELVRLMAHNASLSEAVDARLPGDWPPEFWYEAAPVMESWIAKSPAVGRGWGMWLMVVRRDPLNGQRTLVGDIGFKGPPTPDGRVDIGYSVVASCRNRGYTTEAVGALCEWAFAHDATRMIVGETFATIPESVRVLEKCGFSYAGSGVGREGDEGVLRYERHRIPK